MTETINTGQIMSLAIYKILYDDKLKNLQIILSMLGELKKVQDHLYSNESIQEFFKTHTIHDVIKTLNKTNKMETRTRIKQFFYKINDSQSYKQFLSAGLDDNNENKAQFLKYISSQSSQQYFELLQKKVTDVITLLDNNNSLVPMIFSLVHSPPYGIKMIKLFSELYSKYGDHNCLYSQQIKQELAKGLKSQDSVVQMRFVEIISNIGIHGGRAFEFVKDLLQQSLNIYETQDILLKLNIVQVISILGQGTETSQLLRGHKVWGRVEKDALDHNQQFYVRKSLLILLVNMTIHEQYQMTPNFIKNVIGFLGECFKGQGEYLEAGLQLANFLLRSNESAKLLIQNTQVFDSYLKLSRSPQDRVKNLFVQNMASLTDKTNGKKTKPLVLNILNCVGNPNLSSQLSHNMNSNNYMSGGLQAFCSWFVQLLQLPFQDLEIKLITLFVDLLEYNQVCEILFEDHGTTKYLLRPVGKGNTTKVLKAEKNRLIHRLVEKGSKDWKNTKLETYAVMIEKQLQKHQMDVEYAVEAD